MDKEDTIDLIVLWRIVRQIYKKIIVIIITFTLLSACLSLVLPKKYESSVLIRVKNQKQSSLSMLPVSLNDDVLPAQGYIELARSSSVINPVVESMKSQDYKVDAATFVAKYLSVRNIKGTELIELSVSASSPEDAQSMATGITVSLQNALLNMNKAKQATTYIFLNDSLIQAKSDMEKAEQNLELFRKNGKLDNMESGVTQTSLERQVAVTREVYTAFLKNYEQIKIQEAIEASDIQIIQKANLPLNPSAPKKVLITALGGFLGIMLSLIYILVLYRKNSSSSNKVNRSIG